MPCRSGKGCSSRRVRRVLRFPALNQNVSLEQVVDASNYHHSRRSISSSSQSKTLSGDRSSLPRDVSDEFRTDSCGSHRLAGTFPNARNEIFNITNGDTFRWQRMWPKIARRCSTWIMPIRSLTTPPRRRYAAGAGAQWREARTDYANAIASKPEQRRKRPATVTPRKL